MSEPKDPIDFSAQFSQEEFLSALMTELHIHVNLSTILTVEAGISETLGEREAWS